MKMFSGIAACGMALAVMTLLIAQPATGNPSEDRRARVINDQHGEAYHVLVPGVDASGDINGEDLGTVTNNIFQVENSNNVKLEVSADVINELGEDFETSGFEVAILLYSGDVVVTTDSSVTISADGEAFMEASYDKPDSE